MNNAAAAAAPFKLTADNLETQLATGHVGPFLFTKLLMPKLLAAATPRYIPGVISVSSKGHVRAKGIDFEATMGNSAKPSPPTSSRPSSCRNAPREQALDTVSILEVSLLCTSVLHSSIISQPFSQILCRPRKL
jgi:NAD(P)-dependent dehydrogenase (short-subunit alcohol dehydrogenase family)